MLGTMFQRRARVLNGKRAHADHHHTLAAPIDVCQVVVSACGDDACERLLASPGNLPRDADTVVDRQHHATRHRDVGARVIRLGNRHVAVPVLGDTHDLNTTTGRGVNLLGKLCNVGDHLPGGRVVAVCAGLPEDVLEAVAAFRRVDLRVRVGVHGPNATDEQPLLEHSHLEASPGERHRHVEPEEPGTHHHDVHLCRRLCRREQAARGHKLALVKAHAPLHARLDLSGRRLRSLRLQRSSAKALGAWMLLAESEDGVRPA
mmetsp:Transcript_160295/g.510146  ORF Transcript_160295/g.510146 Transcript_160295/m.510146 type:complete len:261 (+) Transcript_160295:714-1496(+)